MFPIFAIFLKRKKGALESCLIYEPKDKLWSKMTPSFLTVILDVNVMSSKVIR